jgi:mono/diheme cytochrome c family protein/DNA-binding beta-propeller fold protein YncE
MPLIRLSSAALRRLLAVAGLVALPLVAPGAGAAGTAAGTTADPARLFIEHCAACHGADRLGAIGPALLPQNLGRMKPAEAAGVITHGRPATQMPAFAETLTAAEIEALAAWVFSEPAEKPSWTAEDIRASHILYTDPAALPAAPDYDSDPLNLFTVVEAGDHHVTVLDGDTFAPLARFPSRFALHGGIKYSPDGRFAYMASRDGWVSLYDLYGLQMVAEVRAGINTRNIAVSGDGKWVAVGNMVPASVVILDARTLALKTVLPVVGDFGQESRVSAVYTAPPRASFIVALKDLPEVWEIPYVTPRKPYYPGAVHNYSSQDNMTEALDVHDTAFSVRRIRLDDYLDDFFFDQGYENLIGAARNARNGQVVNLTVGRKIAEVPLSGMPHLGSGITWERDGRRVLATPNLKDSQITVIDMDTWTTVATIDTLGPGFFMRSHEASPYAWSDVFFGPDKDKVHIIDKQSLKIVKTLQPAPGKTAAHVEFTADGRYALLSIMEDDGALIVYDAQTLDEVRRLPMKHPVGKYNVANKIRYEEGTSH